MADGNFELDGRPYSYEVLEITGYDGETLDEDEIHEADQVFYKVEAEWGKEETFYRWIGGPFQSMDDIEAAIIDETDHYE